MMKPESVSIIVTTYNRPGHLARCLASIEGQTVTPGEVVIADDGSDEEYVDAMREMIERSPLNVVYARQEHEGYRVAANRNNGVRASRGDYIFFTDGDVILAPDVLEIHLEHACEGCFVTGGYIPLTEEESEGLSVEAIRRGEFDRFYPPSADGRVRAMMKTARRFRKYSRVAKCLPVEWVFRKVTLISCNLSLYRKDFEKVNGFDEDFEGWGREDDDLALRLQLAGCSGICVRDKARVLHFPHPKEPRPVVRRGRRVSANYYRYRRFRWGRYFAENGLIKPGDGQRDE